MRIKNLIFLTSLLLSTNVMSQELFTLEDLNYGGVNASKYRPENRFTAWWGNELVRQDAEECFLVDKKTGKETPLFSLEDVKTALSSVDSAPTVSGLYWSEFPYADKPLCLVSDLGARALYNFKTKKVEWLQQTAGGTAADWSSASHATAFVKDNQLFVTDSDGDCRQLTTDGSREIVYGQSVHRDEFGIRKGTFWSPKGTRLAFYRMDQSMVTDYPQVEIAPAEGVCATYEPDKYPMTGGVSHKVTVGIYDVATRQTVYLQAGDPTDRYFTNIAWSPDESTVYMFEVNRDQNDCRLVAYDAATGEQLKELYRETDEKYVEPLHPIAFLPWDSSKFIMQSQKDGYNHFYLFDSDGHELRQITSGQWVVLDFICFDAGSKSIVYASNEASPIQQNIWRVDVETGKRTLLDTGSGWHYGYASANGRYILDNYSEPTTPRKIDIIDSHSLKITNLLTASDPWEGHVQPEFSVGTLLAADDSTTLYYRMVKPHDFDPQKKYPTIVYVYGGPHAHCVDASWHYESRSWETIMSQKGYILFILDNRGSENRGKEFEQVTFRQLGQEEMKDQMRGVDFLKSLPYVDADRIGVHGWSYGGFMTISLMTNYPDVFKVGVAGGPVIDWKWYEVMYGERYMDTPQSNPEGYAKTSLLGKAKDLKGKLQIITGYNDATVVPQHCLSFIAECIQHGTQPDFFVYPGEPHNMRGHQSVHLHERITQYFEDYLK